MRFPLLHNLGYIFGKGIGPAHPLLDVAEVVEGITQHLNERMIHVEDGPVSKPRPRHRDRHCVEDGLEAHHSWICPILELAQISSHVHPRFAPLGNSS